MSAELQRLVDDLAERLHRSVAVDDPDIQLLAASPHYGAIDPIRMDVILSRKTPSEAVDFVHGLQLARSRGPRRVPAEPRLRILPRLAVPLRHHDDLLGYLWLIDEPPVTEAELAQTVEASRAVARLLAAEAAATDERSAEDTRLLTALLGPDGAARGEALSAVQRSGRLDRDRPWRVSVVEVVEVVGRDPVPSAATQTAARAMRSVLAPTLCGLVEEVFVVVSHDPAWEPRAQAPTGTARPIAERLRAALASRGLGVQSIGSAPHLAGESLGSAFGRARYSQGVAGRFPDRQGVVHWEELGAWQLLYGLPWTRDTVAALHPGIERLLDPEHQELAVTLATYLDSGGNSAATVEALHVHRATLYYRLERIRTLVGTDWEHGWGRLGAHAAMALAGLLDPRVAALPTDRRAR